MALDTIAFIGTPFFYIVSAMRVYYSILLLLVPVSLCIGCRQTTVIAEEFFGASDELPTEMNSDAATDLIPDSTSDVDSQGDTSPMETDNDTDVSTDSDTSFDTGSETSGDSESESGTGEGSGLPSSFSWVASDALISPDLDSGMIAIKDPTAVFYEDEGSWLLYATLNSETGLNMVYLNVSDWAEASEVEKVVVSVNENLSGYKAAPQLFFFSPQQRWYLVYQTQPPAYSTSDNPTDVMSWTGMAALMPVPQSILNQGKDGFDYWVICNSSDCYMFFTAANGVLYRARTPIGEFPSGFEGSTEVVMQDDDPFVLHEGCSVYKISGSDEYLLLVAALGSSGRYYRSWTADRLDGDWVPLAATMENAFASMSNVGTLEWSVSGIEHGEMLRRNPDETMTIDPGEMQFLFSGHFSNEQDEGRRYYSLGLLEPAL